jgi:hypothetical protein
VHDVPADHGEHRVDIAVEYDEVAEPVGLERAELGLVRRARALRPVTA